MRYAVTMIEKGSRLRTVLVDADTRREALDKEACGDIVKEIEVSNLDITDVSLFSIQEA